MKKLILIAFVCCQFLSTNAQVDFRKETIYFLLTPRFYDGDSTNNAPNEWCSYFPGNPNNANFTGPEDVTWRGDFRGLIQKLDYIKDLGFTTVWINPVVQNRGPLDYHGYHAWDFTKVDNRLLSPGAGFKDLIDAAHAKGLKIMLDIVTNHSGRFGIKGVSELKYNTDPNQPWGKDKNGNTLQDNPNWEYDGLTPNPDDNKIWSRANLAKMPPPYNANLSSYNWPSTESFVKTSDPNWFHQWGNGFVQGWDDTTNCYNGAIAGDCPDLNTGSKAVQDYFFNAYKQYIDMGVDAFRWDTEKHMSKEDLQVLIDRFKAVNPNLFIVGEVAQKRHELHQVQELNPHWYTWRGAVGSSPSSGQSVLDFYAEGTFHNIFQDGGAFSGVSAAARYDNLYSDPSQLVTWLDNHDFGPNNDWNQRYSGSDENLAACMNFMFTWRGIPSVYYGTEMRFKSGAWTDIHDAADINKSLDNTGRAYYGNVMNNAPNHIIYKHIKKLNAIRKAIPALQNGTWAWGGNAPGNGIGYTRRSGSSYAVVGLAKDGSASFNFTGVDNGTYRDAVTGRTIVVSNGSLSFTVTSGSAGIYVLNGPGMIGDNGAGFFEPCTSGCTTTPVVKISPVSSNYSTPVLVTLSATGGTGPYSMYYTTNGTAPTTSSTKYTTPFSVSVRTIVRAIAVDAAGKISEVDGQQYTFESQPLVLKATPQAGNYYTPQTVSLSTTGGKKPVKIYYTLNGVNPTTASTLYTTPINISTARTIKALAVDSTNAQTTLIAAYTFNIPPPVVTASPAKGNYPNPPITVTLSATSPKPPVKIYYTTNGTTPTTASTLYTGGFQLNGPTAKVVKFIGVDSLNQTSAVDSAKYTFNPIADIWIYFRKPATWAGAKIHYFNSLPAGSIAATTWPGVNMTLLCNDWYAFKFSGVTSTDLVFNDGAGKQTANLSANATAYYDNGWLTTVPVLCANTPPVVSISPASTTFTDSIKVTLSVTDDKSGSKIYYTTNGTAATTASTVYVNPFWVKTTTTVNATAKDSDNVMATTPVSATYTKTTSNTAPVLRISPASTSFTDSIRVVLAATDDKSGSRIYYTTDGSTPTNKSTRYLTAFNLKSTTIIKAIAQDVDSAYSNIVTGTYTKGNTIIVYFENTANWTQPKVYCTTATPATYVCVDSPGSNMTRMANCGKWWMYTFNGASSAKIVFNNGALAKSALITCSTPGVYNYSWATRVLKTGVPVCTANTPPVVSISPKDTTFTDSIRVTLSVTDDKTGSIIYYTTNGTAAGTTSTVYTAPFWVKTTTTVNATAKDADGAMATATVSATYTKAPPTTGNITVYFENTGGWAQPKVYCWSALPTTYTCAAWPGTNMTKVPNCSNWWMYTFTGVNSTNIIFNNGSNVQSQDLSRTAPGTYNYSWTTKAWANGIPSCNALPVVSISPATSNFTDSLLVTLSVTDDKAGSIIYYTTNGTAATPTSAVYTAPFWVKATTIVNATAKDADGAMAAAQATATYTKTTVASNITVYFENTGAWAQPKVYCWTATPTTYTCAAWPGTNMTKVATCGNWWMYTFTGVNSTNIIFNDGGTTQSANLSRTTTGVFNYSWATKVWANGTPNCTALAKSATEKSTREGDEIQGIQASIIPNPVVNNQFVLKVNSNIAGKGVIRISDAAGKPVKEISNLTIQAGSNYIPVTTYFKSAGFYIAILQVADTKIPIKLMVIK